MVNIEELVKSIRLKEKTTFLKKCLKFKILLPSNSKKGVDRDLLIIQQQRRLKVCLKSIKNAIQSKQKLLKDNNQWPNKKKIAYNQKKKWKKFYTDKFVDFRTRQRKDINEMEDKELRVTKNKKDYKRYKKRKKLQKEQQMQEDITRANNIILNKSEIVLNDAHKLLLARGLNFVPTPKWNDKIEDNEWFSLMRHVRSVEWQSVFQNQDENNVAHLPEKLKIQKFNRPIKEETDEKTQTYVEMVQTKLRYLKPKVNHNYYSRNNLESTSKQALNELKSFVKNKVIVICRSDKDGKIVVVNHYDYVKIMEHELSKFDEKTDLTIENIQKHFDSIRENNEKMIIKLHKEGLVDDYLLRHVIGMKPNKRQNNNKDKKKTKKKINPYSKIPGMIAKNFVCNDPAYAYPLFKTHKLKNDDLMSTNIYDIPTRLLQSAGNIPTSRITSFLEMLLNPISIKYCQYKIDEYCKDSKSYLEAIHRWKGTPEAQIAEDLFLVAADVQTLYPSIKREHVRSGIDHALTTCTDYNETIRQTLVELTMFCLENVVVQNGSKFYHQSQGIITGDNNSVSIANITLHYILLPTADILNKAVIFKRYIDDIMWISSTEVLTEHIEEELRTTFERNGLKLLFRRISASKPGEALEFLDVEHRICDKSTGGFYTTNFIKPTAVDRVFLNGHSHHPRSIFKSVIFSESTRLRRLNERDDQYMSAIEALEDKCYRSGFNKSLVKDMITITKEWKDRFSPPKSHKREGSLKTVWATYFPKLLRLSEKERSLNPTAMVTYRRPGTLASSLTNYKTLAHTSRTERQGFSNTCGRCKLCGKYGGKNMVETTSNITSQSGQKFRLQHHLSCKDFGIYVASCRKCPAQYVGQTINPFSTRWNNHRSAWKGEHTDEDDGVALKIHYSKHHQQTSGLSLADAFTVTFVDKPRDPKNLDQLESAWISRLRASINIKKTVFPMFR